MGEEYVSRKSIGFTGERQELKTDKDEYFLTFDKVEKLIDQYIEQDIEEYKKAFQEIIKKLLKKEPVEQLLLEINIIKENINTTQGIFKDIKFEEDTKERKRQKLMEITLEILNKT